MSVNIARKEEKGFYGIIILFVIVIVICVCLGIAVGKKNSKITLYVVISVLLIIFIAIIVFTELFRRKSKTRREDSSLPEIQSPVLRCSRSDENSWENKRISERSSWISWFPKKSSGNIKPSAPYETGV